MDPKMPWQIIRTKLGYLRNLIIAWISAPHTAKTDCDFSSSVNGAAGTSGMNRNEKTDATTAIDATQAKEIRHPSVSPKIGTLYSLSATGPTTIPVEDVPIEKKPCMRPK